MSAWGEGRGVGGAFTELTQRAAGVTPFPYQVRIAEEGLPEVLFAPTGSGKTMAVVLGWLYRRRFYPDPGVRAATPRWLVLTFPMRVLVEQVQDQVARWLANLGLAGEVGLHVAVGGHPGRARSWRARPEDDAVLVGTLDMLLSRALNRGYGDSRFLWPVDFGLLHNGTHWVFDEVQLMGDALATTRQLQGLRDQLGTLLPTASTWMSATLDLEGLWTVDRRGIGQSLQPTEADYQGPLSRFAKAAKRVRQLPGPVPRDEHRYARFFAEAVLKGHRPGTRTLVVLNSVRRAQQLTEALTAALRDAEAPPHVVTLHARFRPRDRESRTRSALAEIDPAGPGLVVVASQVVEAGVDLDAATLYTELAPWPAIVQRAGRCNRRGEHDSAQLRWVVPPQPAPYPPADLEVAAERLATWEDRLATPLALATHKVEGPRIPGHVLRRRDLLELFDTLPDLSGSDVDVSRFIRPGGDLDVEVAWRPFGEAGPGEADLVPSAAERCRVPIGAAKAWLGSLRQRFPAQAVAWRVDHLDLGRRWVPCRPEDLVPGAVIVVNIAVGGYREATGFDPDAREPVEPVDEQTNADSEPVERVEEVVARLDLGTADDPSSALGRWVSLREHLAHAREEAVALARMLEGHDQSGLWQEAIVEAAALHDIGKAHEVFQEALPTHLGTSGSAPVERPAGLMAKSGSRTRLRYRRPFFRHELAGALALLDNTVLLDTMSDPRFADLVVYLVAAHHGRVRLGFRSMPNEGQPAPSTAQGPRQALGVVDGDILPPVETPIGMLPQSRLTLDAMALGLDTRGRPSWSERMLRLRDDPGVGPFRLGFAEALVRLADWRASERERAGSHAPGRVPGSQR